MKRRWFLRILFLLQILLCIAGWIWSGTNYGDISYMRGGQGIDLFTGEGVVNLDYVSGNPPWFDGWVTELRPTPPNYLFPLFASKSLGFRFQLFRDTETSAFELTVPYWFLIVVFSIAFYVVWRKTRGKNEVKTAFPVDISIPGKE